MSDSIFLLLMLGYTWRTQICCGTPQTQSTMDEHKEIWVFLCPNLIPIFIQPLDNNRP